MEKILVISDSNSGVTQAEGKELGVVVVPMPFNINGKEYLEDVNLSQEQFHAFLAQDADVSTSQPSIYMLEELFEEKLQEYDRILYFPMMASLSSTCAAVTKMAEKFEGKVFVVDNARISVSAKESIHETLEMIKRGYTFEEIKKYLMETSRDAVIYICPDTLKYLKKGGRIKPAAAALATLFKIKPLLYTRGEKFDCCNKCRNKNQAMAQIIKNFKADLETEQFKKLYEEGRLTMSIAYTSNIDDAIAFKENLIKEFPNIPFRFMDPLSLSISCHIGSNAIAAALIINSYLK